MSLIQMSISAAVMIFVITAIRAISINRLPKKTFLALWGLVLARLLVPFTWPSPFSVYSLAKYSGAGQIGGLPIANVLPVIPVTTAPAAVQNTAAVVGVTPRGWIWGIGLALCTLYFAIAYIRCRFEFMTSQPVENEFTVRWLSEHKCRRSVAIRQTSGITAPLTYGIFRPVILMPAETDWTDSKKLQYVLAHEYVHIRRFDGATKLLLTAALCIHWFNPLVWIMYTLANRDLELSCDERVVRMFGETIKSAYALTLIDMEEKKSGLTPLCNHFSKNAIEERIEAIMKIKKTTVCSMVIACAVVAGVGSTLATSAAAAGIPDDLIYIKEDIAVKFVPDPSIYAKYSSFGVTISNDGTSLLYKGQKIRLFNDAYSDETFYYDKNGTVNLLAVRSSAGEITGISAISGKEAQKYYDAFYADETNYSNPEPLENGKKYNMYYGAYGITFRADENALYYNGQKVRLFVDETDGWYPAFWVDETGTADLTVVRDSTGQITGIKSISKEEAQNYLKNSEVDEQDIERRAEKRAQETAARYGKK